ncbi:TPA: YadA-like family protein, partial [Serratia fonticola]|nr:YadA-like family protein [Serratia fonticola]
NATNDQVATNTTDIANNATNITHLGDEISNVYDTGTKYFHANSTGTDSVASGVDAVAIGMGAIASADNSVALGAGSLADGSTLAHQAYLVGGTAKGEVNVGDRRITGLSAGADDMDAVNVAQLKQVTSGAVADAVIYDNTGHNTISLSGSTYKTDTHTGGTVITNVGNGEISSTSSDAVNGSQLNDTNQQVSTNTTSIANNTTNIANNTVKIDGLKDDALQWDATANGGNGAYSANHLGAGPSKLTNVAAGELSTTSTDAVNGSQLNATNDQVATNTTNIATNTSDIANNATNITNLGDEISNVYDTGTKYFHANSTGTDSSATGVDAIAIGMGAVANVNRSIALGDGAKTAAAVGTTGTTIRGTQYAFAGTAPVGTLSVGDVGAERTITNVAAGSLSATSTDAVNGSQLFASNQAIDSITTNIDDLGGRAVKYDLNADGTVNHDKITLAGAPTRITNVAAGNLSATSTDAVNGSQLNATNQQVSINTSNIATNTTDIANNTVKIDGLKDDALQWDATANGGNGAYSANHLGAGPSKLTNVAAGELSTTSTDAVNGSQLNATNEQINTNTVNINGLKQDALLWDSHLGAFSASHGALAVNKITNVARGELSKNSTDAVNGSQLYETNMNVSNLENTINNLKPTDVKYLKVNSTGAGSVATGSEAIAIGANAVASGDNSIASGNGAVSSGIGSIAMGNNTTASGEGSIATGNNAKASGKDSTAIGNGAASTASNSVALGANSLADRDNSVSVGSAGHERQITNLAAGKEDTDAVNVAQLREVSGDVTNVSNAITKISNGTDGMFQVNNTDNLSKPTVTGKNALAGGAGSTASGDNSMTVGTQARSAGTDSVALGNSSSATGRNSVALGTNSTADRDNTVSVGSIGGERQIANVAAGTNGTDAVNVNQLNSGINSSYQYTDNKFNSLKNMIDDNKDKMSAGVAGAMAMASLPQPYAPGASMVSMGGGTYQNQSAVALGVSAISENGKWVTKVAGTSNTQGDFGASVGVGYQW